MLLYVLTVETSRTNLTAKYSWFFGASECFFRLTCTVNFYSRFRLFGLKPTKIPKKEASVELNNIWKAAGKPHQGAIFDKRQSSRLQYRRCTREHQKSNDEHYTNELHNALLQKMVKHFGSVGVLNFNVVIMSHKWIAP